MSDRRKSIASKASRPSTSHSTLSKKGKLQTNFIIYLSEKIEIFDIIDQFKNFKPQSFFDIIEYNYNSSNSNDGSLDTSHHFSRIMFVGSFSDAKVRVDEIIEKFQMVCFFFKIQMTFLLI